MLSIVPNGIYALSFRAAPKHSQDAGETAFGLAIVRNGRLFGSDRGGCVISGQLMASPQEMCAFDGSICAPAHGELITGSVTGPSDLTIAVHAVAIDDAKVLRFRADVAGQPVHVTARYVGPLPRDLPFSGHGCGP